MNKLLNVDNRYVDKAIKTCVGVVDKLFLVVDAFF